MATETLKKAIYIKENLPDAVALDVGNGTITIASPAVITITNHGLVSGQRVYISTTGALPTGLTEDQEYFVMKINANTFNLSLSKPTETVPGVAINTAGTQSGVHTFYRVGYYVHYRVVSEDRGRYSAWSPVYFVEDPYPEQTTYFTLDGGTSTTTSVGG